MRFRKEIFLFIILLLTLGAVMGLRLKQNAVPEDLAAAAEPDEPPVAAPVDTPLSAATPAPTPTVVPSPEPTPTPTPSAEPTPEVLATPEPTPSIPDIDISSWEYILANAGNPIGDYVPELSKLEGSHYFDSRAVDALQDFIDAARGEGLSVFLSSSYRSYAEQQYLYRRKVEQYGGNEAIAATIVAPPGTSEHQTGLCCDITDRYYEMKDSSLENTALFQWMNEHCAEYGFILRYPKDKQDVTGIIYEPWHFRYVGTEAAQYMKEHGLCLEEFLALYR